MSLYCHKNSIGNFYKRRGIIKKTEGQRQQRLKIKDREARRRRGDFMSYERKENTPSRKCAPVHAILAARGEALRTGRPLVSEDRGRRPGALAGRLRLSPSARGCVHRCWPERGMNPQEMLLLKP